MDNLTKFTEQEYALWSLPKEIDNWCVCRHEPGDIGLAVMEAYKPTLYSFETDVEFPINWIHVENDGAFSTPHAQTVLHGKDMAIFMLEQAKMHRTPEVYDYDVGIYLAPAVNMYISNKWFGSGDLEKYRLKMIPFAAVIEDITNDLKKQKAKMKQADRKVQAIQERVSKSQGGTH